jgi:protein TonB
MSVATSSPDGHEAYLRALDRALRIGLVASLVVHAALVGLLPSPFHHEHPMPQTLEVQLDEPPPVPPVASVMEPQATPAAANPVERPAAKPERPRKPKPPQAVRDPVTVPSTATAPEESVLTHREPERAQNSLPSSAANESTTEHATASQAKPESSDVGPIAPPSFRASYLRNPEPAYPAASRRLGADATVQLRVLVSAEGQPVQVDVHRSSGHPRLDEVAAAAVREWRFLPAKQGTTAVEATVIVPIVFRLEAE